jgi:aminopeptidase
MTLTRIQMERYADVLLWGMQTARGKSYKAGDVVLLRYDIPGIELAEIINRRLVERRFIVVQRALSSPAMEKDFLSLSEKQQRRFLGDWDRTLYENLHGNILVSAPSSLTHLKDIDPGRINDVAVTRKPLREIMDRRDEKGLFGWTLCTFPTAELARQAKMTLKEYSAQIVKACFLGDSDPVARWKEIFASSREIKKWLNSLPILTLRLESKSADLTITPGERRRFIGISGHNIPSFEIFTSPDWRGTRGRYYADQPSFRAGNYVSGVTLEFRDGSVVRAEAKTGGRFLKKMVAMDRGAGRIGEFSLTDRRFSRIDRFMADTLFDENYGGKYGNSHIALGSSYSDTFAGDPSTLTAETRRELGFNDSALHWDLVNTEDKIVTATLRGGRTVRIYEKGMFQY